MRNTFRTVIAMLSLSLVASNSLAYVSDEGDQMAVYSVADAVLYNMNTCEQAQMTHHYLWCQNLLCQGERVANACCLAGEHLDFTSQTKGDYDLAWLWRVDRFQCPEKIAFFIVADDGSQMEQKVLKDDPSRDRQLCDSNHSVKEVDLDALRYNLAGCQLRLLACGAEFDPTGVTLSSYFDECRSAPEPFSVVTSLLPSRLRCEPCENNCPPHCGGGLTSID
ncbi:MAG: hypothetical protein NTU97_01490 [Candidatus Magasanikbacteria bacterium]|nr:hypothetical protein [Candidatus Magasanikbacteria bacterium]